MTIWIYTSVQDFIARRLKSALSVRSVPFNGIRTFMYYTWDRVALMYCSSFTNLIQCAVCCVCGTEIQNNTCLLYIKYLLSVFTCISIHVHCKVYIWA